VSVRISRLTWVLLGCCSLLPLGLLLIGILFTSISFEPVVLIAIVLSMMLSVVFVVIGLKYRFPFMLVWMVAFIVLLPFSNIVFWLLYSNKFKAKGEVTI
jgi:hypothetical protein